MKKIIKLKANGDVYEIAVSPNRTLLEALRYDCHLTGSKQGCDIGDCGACTVLIDNVPIQACITLAIDCVGKEILTVEGIAAKDKPHPVQIAWNNQGASQCGYCTPGFIVVAKWLMDKNPNPSDDEIKQALSGNICRCTGYTKIMAAMREAVGLMNEKDNRHAR